MPYHVTRLEQEARDQLVTATLAYSADPSSANRHRWQEADEYFDALLAVIYPPAPRTERRIPAVGIPHTPAADEMAILELEALVAELRGEASADAREMTRTAYDTSYSLAPRSQDRRPPGRSGDMHMPQRTEYVPQSDSAPTPDRIRRQIHQLRREHNRATARNTKGN